MSKEVTLELLMLELKDMRNRMATKDDIAKLQTDVTSMKGDISNLQIDMTSIKSTVSRIESKLDLTYKQTGILSEFRTEVLQRMDQLATKEDLEYLDKKIGEHDREIFKLKNNPKRVNG